MMIVVVVAVHSPIDMARGRACVYFVVLHIIFFAHNSFAVWWTVTDEKLGRS